MWRSSVVRRFHAKYRLPRVLGNPLKVAAAQCGEPPPDGLAPRRGVEQSMGVPVLGVDPGPGLRAPAVLQPAIRIDDHDPVDHFPEVVAPGGGRRGRLRLGPLVALRGGPEPSPERDHDGGRDPPSAHGSSPARKQGVVTGPPGARDVLLDFDDTSDAADAGSPLIRHGPRASPASRAPVHVGRTARGSQPATRTGGPRGTPCGAEPHFYVPTGERSFVPLLGRRRAAPARLAANLPSISASGHAAAPRFAVGG